MSSTNAECLGRVGWNIIGAAAPFSALSGVLAGFLIASAAVLFAPGGRCVPYTVALLASGVPGLAFSSYIFAALAGLDDKADCSQTWSQGLVATALLLVGGAVLVCGFSWVLVTYSEDLEFILSEQLSRDGRVQKQTIRDSEDFKRMVRDRCVLLISLNGWISAGVIVTTTAILTRINVLYIHTELFTKGTSSKLLEGVALIVGSYTIVRTVYTISRRTHDALKVVGGSSRQNQDLWESLLFLVVTLASVMPVWLANLQKPLIAYGASSVAIFLYSIGRSILRRRRHREEIEPSEAENSLAQVGADSPSHQPVTSLGQRATSSGDAIKALIWSDRLFQIGKLSTTTRNIVIFATAGLLFAAATMQRPLVGVPQMSLTLLLGGLYPALILIGLSRSVASRQQFCSVPRLFTGSIGKWIP